MRTPALVSIVIALHVMAVGAFIFIQGCESLPEGPPPAPVMPPRVGPGTSPRIPTPPERVPEQPTARSTMEGATHVVSKGETLSHIATRYGIGWRELAEYNNMEDPGKIRVGDKLIIPPYAKAQPSATSAAPPGMAAPPSQPPVVDRTGASEYVVQAGDHLTRIARMHGVKISDIKAANQLQSDMIRVGQKLTIPAAGAAAEATPTVPPAEPEEAPDEVQIEDIVMPEDTGTLSADTGSRAPPPQGQGNDLEYIVMDGDTLDEIAKLFIVSKQSLIDYNGLRTDQELKVGDVIKIPPSAL